MWLYIVTAGLAALAGWFWWEGADFSFPLFHQVVSHGDGRWWQQGSFLKTQVAAAKILFFIIGISPLAGLVAGFTGPLFASAASDGKMWRAKFIALFFFPAFLPPAGWAALYFSGVEISVDWAVAWALGALAGWALLVFCGRFFTTVIEQISHRLTKKTSLERNRKTDVREIHKFLPERALEFNPVDFFDEKKGVFLGLDEDKTPVHLPVPTGGMLAHIQIAATSGAGKGVALAVMAAQFLKRGEAVFFMDPKDDEWAPHVLHQECVRMGVPFHFVDLRPGAEAQLNPLAGVSRHEAFELFSAAFSLSDKGAGADFYSISDRKAARETADFISQHGCTLAAAHGALAPELAEKAAKFEGKLAELASLASINARQGGVDLAHVVDAGGCVYVVGSMRNDSVKTAQRMLLVKFIQLAEARDRMAGVMRPISIILDELKYHISRPALEALGAARDKGVHVVLAHQSLGDLRDCPMDLNPDAVVDAVDENCPIKLVYKVVSVSTAEWFAELSGEILVDDEIRKVERNSALVEQVEGDRTIKQDKRFLIDTNMIKNLPARVGVLYGVGLARFVSIQPIPTQKDRAAITPSVVNGDQPAAPAQKIDVADPPPRKRNRADSSPKIEVE